MPNWCNNTLTVSGNAKDIKKFKKKAEAVIDGKKQVLALGSFVPDKGGENWYDWRIENWGTKWELNEVELYEDTAETAVYAFDTAWSPPTEWLYKVAEQYPSLTFRLKYREDGMCFMGVTELRGTEVLEQSDMDTAPIWELYDTDTDEGFELVVQELDRMEDAL